IQFQMPLTNPTPTRIVFMIPARKRPFKCLANEDAKPYLPSLYLLRVNWLIHLRDGSSIKPRCMNICRTTLSKRDVHSIHTRNGMDMLSDGDVFIMASITIIATCPLKSQRKVNAKPTQQQV